MVSIKRAAEMIGISECNISNNNSRYNRFLHGNKRDKLFDIKSYNKWESDREMLLEKTKLFIEYLVHIEGMNYRKIAKLTDTREQTIGGHTFGFNMAIKIARKFVKYRPFHVKRFDQYYGWESKSFGRSIEFRRML